MFDTHQTCSLAAWRRSRDLIATQLPEVMLVLQGGTGIVMRKQAKNEINPSPLNCNIQKQNYDDRQQLQKISIQYA